MWKDTQQKNQGFIINIQYIQDRNYASIESVLTNFLSKQLYIMALPNYTVRKEGTKCTKIEADRFINKSMVSVLPVFGFCLKIHSMCPFFNGFFYDSDYNSSPT